MKSLIFTLIIFLFANAVYGAVSISEAARFSFIWPEKSQLVEGEKYFFQWNQRGIESVSIVAEGDLTDIPQGSRGRFQIVVADAVPAGWGKYSWIVPFLDTINFRVEATAYNAAGLPVAKDERVYKFRPDILKDRHKDGIYIDVRTRDRQRLYVLKGGRLYRSYLTSGADTNAYYPRHIHPKRSHDHYGVFKVAWKTPIWYSRLYQVNMPWAMNYWNGHFIHATSSNFYHKLGRAASHGCNRLERSQARELYRMTPVGTRVEIIVK
jgi:hypothetical protein